MKNLTFASILNYLQKNKPKFTKKCKKEDFS